MTNEELREIAKAEKEAKKGIENEVRVCVAASCLSMKSDEIKEALQEEVVRQDKGHKCRVTGVGCLGLCSKGPLVRIEKMGAEVEADQESETEGEPEAETGAAGEAVEETQMELNAESVESTGILYQNVSKDNAADIIASLGEDDKAKESAAAIRRLERSIKEPFFERQHKIVLENCGKIDPYRIEDYITAGGYEIMYEALTEMSPAQVIEEVTKSGLRGRGGGGYPTGLKWSTVYKTGGDTKYVICNADEGDPGAFMDRSVLEGDPHRVIEGMVIAAYAVEANHGYIYVRAEYPLAIKTLKKAIQQAEKMGLIGRNICGTTFSFDLNLRLGAGAFVTGEETALISSVEGRRGVPRPRPPYPAQRGLWGKPTLINNVETFANVVPIIRDGGEKYAGIGTEKSKGTKVFALAGRIKNTGLIEVPMGTTLREIIFDIGGGIPESRNYKAVQTGGPSGGCVPEQFLDMPVDYDSLMKVGSIMGSGGIIVMDETSCMVDVARYFMEFCMSESCGKCVPCRVGTVHMHELIRRITTGEAMPEDFENLLLLSDMVKNTSLCGLGQSAPNPVLSTIKYFKDEYDAHIHDKVCPAGVCKIRKPTELKGVHVQ